MAHTLPFVIMLAAAIAAVIGSPVSGADAAASQTKNANPAARTFFFGDGYHGWGWGDGYNHYGDGGYRPWGGEGGYYGNGYYGNGYYGNGYHGDGYGHERKVVKNDKVAGTSRTFFLGDDHFGWGWGGEGNNYGYGYEHPGYGYNGYGYGYPYGGYGYGYH